MKTLLIFALVLLISCYYEEDLPDIESSTIKCPDDKIKIGQDVCAITVDDSTEAITYVKKKSCGKNKACLYTDTEQSDDIYTCQRKLKLLKIGQKCNYNAECYTEFCNGGKCAVYDDTKECDRNENCGPDKYCEDEKCVAYVTEGGDCSEGEECAPGYNCDDSESPETCKKLFTLGIGETSSSEEFCKTLNIYDGKCIEVVKVDKNCSLTYKDKDGGEEKTLKIEDDTNYNLATPDKKCRYVYKPKELIDDLIEIYNKIKLNKLLEKKKEDCDYGIHNLCDKKFAELRAVYENYDILLEQDIIKANGEKNKDKSCEYEFFKSMISSSYVSICFGFTLVLLGLLF